jgi:cytochrome c-type biogenesis protein CcmF
MIISIACLFGAVICALLSSIVSFTGRVRPGKYLFYAAVSFILLAAVLLLIFLFTSDFSIKYVAMNSSHNTPLVYKLSALWAGQEGSLLLWILFTSLALIPSVKRGNAPVILVSSALIFIMLIILAVWANPFAPNMEQTLDGRGLNPLLRNFWMAIHPPLLFAGYAFAGVLYVRSIASFINGGLIEDNDSRRTELFLCCGFLSLGIATGAVWAYGTLGWGGFWGWDPVENGSLIAWILSAAVLYHGFSGRDKFSNVLVALPFISVAMFSFLTRSGLFSNVSVHSFSASPLGVPLGVLFSASAAVPLFYFIRAAVGKKKNQSEDTDVAVHLIYICAVIIIAGTLIPVVTGFASGRPYLLRPSFFSMIALVFASVFFVMYAGRIFMTLAKTKRISSCIIFAAGLTCTVIWIPFDLWIWLLSLSSCAALSVYFSSGFSGVTRGIAAAGLAFLALGSAGSGYLEDSYMTELQEGRDVIADSGRVQLYGFVKDSSGESGSFMYKYRKTGYTEIIRVDLTGKDPAAQKPVLIRHMTHDVQIHLDAYYPGDKEKDKPAELLISVVKKPLMNFVWLGFLMICVSFFVHLFLHLRKRDNA